MLGKNPVAKRRRTKDFSVTSVFDTLQGEGPFVGTPAIFVRLAGCNLQCSFCDTDFQEKEVLSPEALVDRIEETASQTSVPSNRIVVLTGGEPLLQPVELLFYRLALRYFSGIQIETAGTVLSAEAERTIVANQVSVVVSPKTPKLAEGFSNPRKELLDLCYYKYLVDAEEHEDIGPPLADSKNGFWKAGPPKDLPKNRIFLQPVDTGSPPQNELNLRRAINLCSYYGYRLSVQTHKILRLP